jgi:Protein of unknown function (DUF2516)
VNEPYEAWLIQLVFYWAAIPVGAFAFIHALSQRPDAYVAIDRMTKQAWLGITGGGLAALLLNVWWLVGWLFLVPGLVAVLVYIVDMRPKLIEVQRGQRW